MTSPVKTAEVSTRKKLRLSLPAWRRSAECLQRSKTPLPARIRVAYFASSGFHSLLFKIQDASRAELLKSTVPLPPIFILGFWRSGTTLLHELICTDTSFGFPSTYACLNPSHFLLTEQWNSNNTRYGQVKRPMDNVSFSWASPQEDEFALLALGARSPYEALLAPSLMRDPKALVDFNAYSAAEQRRWKDALVHLLRLFTVQQGKPMVLKSPPHGFRLQRLATLFPDARFILIERNPYEVFASNLKLWPTLLDIYALEDFSPAQVERFVLEAYLVHERSIFDGAQLLGSTRLARVSYEDLTRNPVSELESLYARLGLGDFSAVRSSIEQRMPTLSAYRRNRLSISAEQKKRLEDAWGSVIREKGYIWPEQYLSVAV